MSVSSDLRRQQDVIRRLRELHQAAADEDRPQAALLLGLAIADLVALLPEGDPLRGDLGAEGRARLAESADATATTRAARELLAHYPAASADTAAAGEPARPGAAPAAAGTAPGLESFPLDGGDLNWDVDWQALQGPAEAARNMTAMLPFLASMLPEQAPLRQALTAITETLAAFDRGQWSPDGDAALQRAISQVEASGLGTGLGLMLRMMAMMFRVHRCQQAQQQGAAPDWPTLAEIDALIAGLQSAEDLTGGLGEQFQAVDGLHHMYIAGLIMMRLLVSIRLPDVRRDAAWRADTLRLLSQADDHLGRVPAAYTGQVQALRAKLAEMAAALSRAAGLPTPRAAARPGKPPSAPAPPAAPPAPIPDSPGSVPDPPTPTPDPPTPTPDPAVSVPDPPVPAPAGTPLTGLTAAAAGTGAGWFDPALAQFSQRIRQGLEILVGQADGPLAKGLAAMLPAMDAVYSRQGAAEYSHQLAELEREADRLAGQDGALTERAMVAAMLAMLHAVRCHQRSLSPRPAEHPAAGDYTALIAETESAIELLSRDTPGLPDVTLQRLVVPLHAQAAMLLVDLSRHDTQHQASLLARARAHFGELPAEMLDQLPVFRDLSVLEQLIEGVVSPDDPAVESVADRNPGKWDRTGGDLQRAKLAVSRAQGSRAPADIAAAIMELQTVWIGLDAGSPMRAQVLVSLATMQSLLAAQTGDGLSASDAASTAIEAVRAATAPGEVHAAAQLLVTTFALMLSHGQRAGPFQDAAEVLQAALADRNAQDWALRTTVLTAIGAATALRAAGTGDEALRATGRESIAAAEQLLPEPAPDGRWYAAARILATWAVVAGLCLNDGESRLLALRLIDRLESVLRAAPEVAGQVTGQAAGPEAVPGHGELDGLQQLREQLLAAGRQPATPDPALAPAGDAQAPADMVAPRDARHSLAQAMTALGLGPAATALRRPLAPVGRPDPDVLRSLAADLHRALAGTADDPRLRRQIDRMLGICHAELYWSGAAARTDETLREAVVHLNRALTAADHALPTVEWADTLDVLARCLRAATQRDGGSQPPGSAERTARAALRELARCVLVAADTSQALDVAARANELVIRAAGWALADNRPRAAVDIAEAGRGLVLASVVLSGRVEEVLRGAGRAAVADAWRAGGEPGRVAALDALRETTAGDSLLATPIGEEISLTMGATRFDAVVYLVPPAEPDLTATAPGDPPPGHAVLVRPVLGQIDVVPLPGLACPGGGTPLDAYLAALDSAVSGHDAQAGNADGFRAGQAGQAWADALDELGRWTYATIMGPLLQHIRGWSLDHLPQLALIPVGDLAAIPYAAAWTGDGPPGERRYAIDDVVLSYAASARLLAETARRRRQPLSERVVLVSEPGGELPMTRRITRQLFRRQYPGAEVYGLKSDRNGPATGGALLGALPERDRPGASLLQLSLHGRAVPSPGLLASDGWLPLARILDQARDRAPDAPGGLVVTNACLTDSTRTHYDESITLATAFLAAGATAVIGTRWPVDDDTAAALSLRLHYHLQVGCRPAEALRHAQLDLLRPTPGMRATLGPHLGALSDTRLSHPVTWAGHVHHGI